MDIEEKAQNIIYFPLAGDNQLSLVFISVIILSTAMSLRHVQRKPVPLPKECTLIGPDRHFQHLN